MSATQIGLRERKKLRTRATIVDVAFRLFTERGYHETTLVQIAEAADISPSTFFNYFPSKVDIVFGFHDALIESARRRIVEHDPREGAVSAVVRWVAEDLREVERPYFEVMRVLPKLVESVPELMSEGRVRGALLEDVFAEAFAADLEEPMEGMRARVMATIAFRGMLEVWEAWYPRHAADVDFDPSSLVAIKADYLERALDAGMAAVRTLPPVPEA